MILKGIDVSVHNGSINWNQVKNDGVQFAILRAGYGREISQKDQRFEEYYANAKAVSMPVGSYWYSYATGVEEARIEAQVCLSIIKGKQFEYPVYFDLEEQKAFATGKSNCSAMVRAFCGELEKARYFAGLYMSRSPFNSYMEDDIKTKYALWLYASSYIDQIHRACHLRTYRQLSNSQNEYQVLPEAIFVVELHQIY